MSDPIVISTDDVCVRASDLKTVEAGFLSDMIISFVFCELERSLPTSFKSEITLLQATTVYMANSMSADELAMILSSLKLNEKSVVFLPVNNNSNPDMAFGGSHWSLLLFVRTLNEFWYFDSYANSNQRVATSVARNFATALGASNSYKFVCKDTPQQENGVDCGVYVIQLGEKLLSNLISSPSTATTTVVVVEDNKSSNCGETINNNNSSNAVEKLNYSNLLNHLDTITPTSIATKRKTISADILERAKQRLKK